MPARNALTTTSSARRRCRTDRTTAAQRCRHGLVLVSTPIGNLGDMTARARRSAGAAPTWCCARTRATPRRLLAALGIEASCKRSTSTTRTPRIPGVLALLRAGRRVALVSDAGTPLMSDPGFRLVRAAIAEGLPVSARTRRRTRR